LRRTERDEELVDVTSPLKVEKSGGFLQLDVQLANRPVKRDTGNTKLTGGLGHIVAIGAQTRFDNVPFE
jgi:hypothetical protein